jgi:integrase
MEDKIIYLLDTLMDNISMSKQALIIKEEDKEVFSNFYDSLKTAKTQTNYLNCIQQYMRFLKTDSYASLLDGNISENIKSWILDRRGKVSSGAIDVHIYALQHFYEMNDVDNISWKKLKRFKGEETPTHEDRGYSHTEIQTVLSVADVRLKPIILLLSSGGMRIGALPSLKLKHLTKKDNCYKIDVYAGTREHYYTFCSPECRSYIEQYLEFRTRYGEHLNPESPLFRKSFDIEIPEKVRTNVTPLSLSAMEKDISKYLERVGLRTVNHEVGGFKNRKEVKLAHGFRKFFATQCLNSKLMGEYRILLEGHELEGNDPNYARVTEDELFSEYETAIDNLTIDPANRLRKKVEVLTLEKSKLDNLAAAVAALEMKIK